MFKTIKNSVWNPSFYKEIESYSVGKAIWYFVKLSLLIGLLAFIISAITMIAKGGIMNEFVGNLIASYPEDVVVKIDKGVISQSPEGVPIVIPLEGLFGGAEKNLKFSDDGIQYSNTKEGGDKELDVTNIVVVDTSIKGSPTIEQFRSADTAILITEKFVVNYDDNESISFNDVSKYPDFTLDYETFKKFVGYGKYVPYVLPIFFFIGGFFLSVMTLIGLFFLAVILFVVESIFKSKITFANAFKTCVYASSIPLIIHVTMIMNTVSVPYLFSLLTLLIALVNLKGKARLAPPVEVVTPIV